MLSANGNFLDHLSRVQVRGDWQVDGESRGQALATRQPTEIFGGARGWKRGDCGDSHLGVARHQCGALNAPRQGTAQADCPTMVILVPDNKTEDDYGHWSRQIGKQSELGVQLQVAISYSDRSGPHVIATGTVGVPRPPEDDFERHLLATKIADLIEAPDIAIFSFTGLLWWRVVKGGPFQVDLTETRQLRQLDESEVSNSVSMSGPGR